LEKNLDKITWSILSENPAAISLLEKNPEKISWNELSYNPGAISILKKNPEKINWYFLSANSAAISLLEENPEKIINYPCIFKNPDIFELDIEQYKKDLNLWINLFVSYRLNDFS